MTRQQLLKKYESLPPTERRKVDNLLQRLSTPKPASRTKKSKTVKSWTEEPAFGMWKDRQDMGDSAAWVRNFRRQHWDRQRG